MWAIGILDGKDRGLRRKNDIYQKILEGGGASSYIDGVPLFISAWPYSTFGGSTGYLTRLDQQNGDDWQDAVSDDCGIAG